ncbi:MAG: DeoR family transcriptional regulator [Candidatus Portnoybacteria bacterium]
MQELNDRALKLGLALYRVTKLFPGGEVLIGQMRSVANEVLSDLVLGQKAKAGKKTEIALNYLQVARAQNWVKNVNFDILIRGYGQLLDEINKDKKKQVVKDLKQEKKDSLNERQKAILKYIKEEESVQLRELTILFPKITPRTIRNDLNNMVKKKILVREGDKRTSVYKIDREIDKEI